MCFIMLKSMSYKPAHLGCRTDVYAAIHAYMNKGWVALTQLFQNVPRRGKEKTLAHSDVKKQYALALEMLGAIRKFAVNELFACVNRGRDNSYAAFGSTNITSDYDLTIKGMDVPDIMWRMFQKFWSRHRNTLPHAFDSNIYCTGLYQPRGLRPNLRTRFQLIDEGQTAVMAPLQDDAFITIPAACMKLLDEPPKLRHFPRLWHEVKAAQVWKQKLDAEINRDMLRIKAQDPLASKDTREVAAKYHLQYVRGRKLLREIYGAKKDGISAEQALRTACEANYFAMEAYYAPDTVNVVVGNLQKGDNLKLPASSFACALLENVGDLRTHALHGPKEGQDTKILLLKYSK